MLTKCRPNEIIFKVIQLILIIGWTLSLIKTHSEFSIYLVAAAAAVLSCIFTELKITLLRNKVMTGIAAVIMSLCVTLANYRIAAVYTDNTILAALIFVFIFISGYTVFANIMKWVFQHTEGFAWKSVQHKLKAGHAFIIVFAALTLIYSVILVIGYYPGVLTPDSITQLDQIGSGVYTNHHPFFHTMLIRLCLWLGNTIFASANIGTAIYSELQIILLAASLAYVLMTLHQMKLSYKLTVPVFAWFVLMPYFFLYAITMWKDTLFGAACAVLVTSLFRLTNRIGRSWSNYILLVLGSLGTCLLRSNGWLVFICLLIVSLFVYGKKFRKMLFVLFVSLMVSVVLKYPILSALNVTQPDLIESLSIPCQQIARVLADGEELTADQTALLANVIDVDKIAGEYLDYTSDNIKLLVRAKDNQDYIKEHKLEFIKLYIEIGLQHPASYFKGWVDETVGYWNGGYGYWSSTEIELNNSGISRTVNSYKLRSLLDKYTDLFTNCPVTQPLTASGLCTWIAIGLLAVGIARKKKSAVLTVPALALVATLMIATPICAEFRYEYAAFTTLPVMFFASFGKCSN